ncbi:MAG TPA: alpha/beta fold hydrolase [Kofleriaceae bacterium]|jgi:triacylglycerol lipase|nr:alpha/beta fold hydrolase [Kofleriaceae bacterium]
MRHLAALAFFLSACAVAPAAPETSSAGDGKLDSPDSTDNPREPDGLPTQYPLVLVHGFNASAEKNGFGPEVVEALCADGHAVFAPSLPPFASAETRAAALAKAIDSALAGDADACGVVPAERPRKVNLIAHSMGGLDSRAVISTLGYGDRVASLTTLSTPHRGSAFADMLLGLTANVDDDAMSALATWLGRPLTTDATQLAPDLRAALTSLAEQHADAFNTQNPNDTRVRYESWAGLSNVAGVLNPQDAPACEYKLALFPTPTARHTMSIALKPIAYIVAHRFDLRPNDGLVQVSSAKWGTFRGCVPADHADEVGAFPVHKFDHVRFMRNRAFDLAARGY